MCICVNARVCVWDRDSGPSKVQCKAQSQGPSIQVSEWHRKKEGLEECQDPQDWSQEDSEDSVVLLTWNKYYSLSHVWLFMTPWTVAHQALLSMEFSRQEYWSGLLFRSPGESSWPRDRTQVFCIAGRFFTIWATREIILRAMTYNCKRIQQKISKDKGAWGNLQRDGKLAQITRVFPQWSHTGHTSHPSYELPQHTWNAVYLGNSSETLPVIFTGGKWEGVLGPLDTSVCHVPRFQLPAGKLGVSMNHTVWTA